MSRLLSPSESLAFRSFLTSVDRTSAVEFQEVSPDLANRITIKQGRDALAKATMDLLAQGDTALGEENGKTRLPGEYPGADVGIYMRPDDWPAVDVDAQYPSMDRHRSGSRRSKSASSTAGESRSSSQNDRHSPRGPSQSDATRSLMSVSLPPLSDHLSSLSRSLDPPPRNLLHHSISAPAGISPKRALPADGDGRPSASSSAPKRSRRSPSASDPKPRRQSSAALPAAAASSGKTQGKPPLLSPSQKRANHIQSEQKRRANIKRGYEALCSAVPNLRDAIAREEAGGDDAADADAAGKGRRKRKKADEAGLDGRAGPKSENVVLSKTIEYVKSLLTERQQLLDRLKRARSRLPTGHPAVLIETERLDNLGVALWEREWNGGTGILDDAGGDEDDGDEEGGSDDDT